MLQTGTAYTPSQIMSLRLKGAMYIRMSTELQVESPENQERAIRTYAAQYGIEIIKTYADLGVSGINTEMPMLQQEVYVGQLLLIQLLQMVVPLMVPEQVRLQQ